MEKVKPTSIRLSKTILEKIDNACGGLGCSRTDWIKDTIDDKLEDEFRDDSQDQEVIKDTKPISKPKKNSRGGFFVYKEKTPLENEQSKTKTLREFDVKEGRMIENGYDIGSTSNYYLMGGNVWKNGELIGKIIPS